MLSGSDRHTAADTSSDQAPCFYLKLLQQQGLPSTSESSSLEVFCRATSHCLTQELSGQFGGIMQHLRTGLPHVHSYWKAAISGLPMGHCRQGQQQGI